jgi:hypothetical protein
MTSIDIQTTTDTPDQALTVFTWVCRDIVQRYAGHDDPAIVMAMTEEQQQALVDRINPHLAFELSQTPELHDVPLKVTGYGLMFVADAGGEILGAETVSHGDVITGTLSEAWACPVPTMESVQLSDAESTPILGQTMAGVLLLNDAVYKTGLNRSGDFEIEHDLSNFQIGIPLSHLFDVRHDTSKCD